MNDTYLIYIFLHLFLAGSKRFSSTSHVSASQYSEYSEEIQTYGSNLLPYLTKKREKENLSLTQKYNILSKEIGVSTITLAGFYRHQTNLKVISMDNV